jgi:hypothetical protein
MRMKEICERRHAPFRLRVRIDGETAREALLSPAGASGDRPLYVFEELPVLPGAHRIEVLFREERPDTDAPARPARTLALDTTLDLAPRDVALVTLDESGEKLAATTPGR